MSDRLVSDRLRSWWFDDLQEEPGRLPLNTAGVPQLAEEIAPGSSMRDLGGHFSLNVHLEVPDLVLRVHQPFVSRRRLLDLQDLRQHLSRSGLKVPVAIPHAGRTVFRCAGRWAELEPYISHDVGSTDVDRCTQVISDLGRLHRDLMTFSGSLTRPVIATWATPGSLRRWLTVTQDEVGDDAAAVQVVDQLTIDLGRLSRRWVPLCQLDAQVVHGDGKSTNLPRTAANEAVALDFGFAARRPRVHDLAYSVNWTMAALGEVAIPHVADWIKVFEDSSGRALSAVELEALPALGAAIAFYRPAVAGFNREPVADLLHQRRALLEIAWWLDDDGGTAAVRSAH